MAGSADPMFRGFITISGKRALMKFKDVPSEKLLDEETADKLGDYAAILSNDAVVIDVDSEDDSNRLLDILDSTNTHCRVYRTSRGKHFLFYNRNRRITACATAVFLAVGIKADIKVGTKNSYIVRKRDGKLRPTLRDGEVDELPPFLIPVNKDKALVDMAEGDGRNTALYSYILTLQKAGLRKDEVKDTLRIINSNVFATPLPDKELEAVMRDDAFQPEGQELAFWDAKDKFMFDVFAVYIANKYHVVNINNQLYSWNGLAYTESTVDIERHMIEEIPHLAQRQRSEVLSYLRVYLKDKRANVDYEKVSFTNGIYDIIEDTMMPLSPDVIVTNPIPHRYDPDAYSAIADKFLDDLACGDKSIRMLLEEVMGFSFLRRNELRKSFLLYGGRHNGKSTFLSLLTNMLGEANVTSLDLKDIGDRFKTAELYGKLACIGDDIDDDFIKDTSMFKKAVSGDRMNAERKGQDPFDFNPYAKLFFSANSMPRMKDRTGAVLERLVIVPFLAEFDSSNPDYDPYIKYKLRKEECMEYFVNVAVQGLRRVLLHDRFTYSAKVQEYIDKYDEENDNVLMWINSENPDINNHTCADVYFNYSRWCDLVHLTPLSMSEFGKQLKRRWKYNSKPMKVGNKVMRVYSKD